MAATNFKKMEGDLGRSAPSQRAAATVRPTAEDIAEVDDLVDSAIVTLSGTAAIADQTAYAKATAQNKFQGFLQNLNQWVSGNLTEEARWQAWEAVAHAQQAGSRAAMAPEVRRRIDQLDRLYRAEQPAATATSTPQGPARNAKRSQPPRRSEPQFPLPIPGGKARAGANASGPPSVLQETSSQPKCFTDSPGLENRLQR